MACAADVQVRSLDGAKAAFDPPRYVVKGKTTYDQQWIDGQIEAGVAAFNWSRPKPRPAELDAPKAVKAPPLPPKKPFFRRILGR